MAYTKYRNSRVSEIKPEEVSPRTRPQEIADFARRRSNYQVTVAVIDGISASVSISEFRKMFNTGDNVSVAVDDNWNVIAFVNHSSGQSGCIQYRSTPFSEYIAILFYIAIPGVLCFAIARKAFNTVKYHDAGWYIAGAGVLIIALILFGVNKQYLDSRSALRKLKAD